VGACYINFMDKDVEELLSRGVDKVYPSKENLKETLLSGKKLKLYQGFDPTGDKLHLGHLVGLRKLADWQAQGHQVIFLIGDGTGQAGDPSGKTKSRETFFSQEELRKNATDYVKQAQKIVRFDGENPVEVKFNGDWLNELKLPDILNIAGNFSWQQLAERDLFQERIKSGETLNLREALYPLLQAYDSVALDVDLEIGGSDQMFNMLFGRTLLKAMKNKDKFVLTTPLLADASGRKIGKSEGNVIALTDEPNNLYGKIMSLPDEVVVKCFECLTRIPLDRVKEIVGSLEKGENPITFKKELAFQIVSDLHSVDLAKEAQDNFEETFSKGGIPKDIQTVQESKDTPLAEVLLKHGLVSSKTEFNRLNNDGAIKEIENGVYRIGKHRFLKIDFS
jgi:tyrosyl-tRNA synthetase